MPDEAIVGGLLRMIGSVIAAVAEFLLEYAFERTGRLAIYVLTLGRVDTDLSAREGVNWMAATVGFLVAGGLIWSGFRIFS